MRLTVGRLPTESFCIAISNPRTKRYILYLSVWLCIAFAPRLYAGSLVAYYTFGDVSGELLKDRSYRGNDGWVNGSPKTVNGKIGKAMEFDGVNDFVIIQNHDSYNFGKDDPFSISLWINYAEKGDWQGILQKFNGSCGFDIGVQPDNRLYFAIHDGTNTSKVLLDTPLSGWHHCCFIRDTKTDKLLFSMDRGFESDLDNAVISRRLQEEFSKLGIPLSQSDTILVKEAGNEWQITSNQQIYNIRKEGDRLNVYTDKIRVYIDGNLAGESEDRTSAEIANTSPLYISAREPGNIWFYKGALDEIAIYDRVLTKDEIKQAMKGNLPEVYHESSLRRFEIIFTASLPFTALHSYLIVRGIEMVRQNKVAPRFEETDWHTIGGLMILFSAGIGLWDYLHTHREDISEITVPVEHERYTYLGAASDTHIGFWSMRF